MEIYTHIVIPLLIFFARIVDVSLGTLRVLLISKGKKVPATLLGFIEAGVWLLAIREILNNLDSVVAYIAYPAGYAIGTLVGMILEEKLIKGKYIIRVIVKQKPQRLIANLKKLEQSYSIVDAEGSKGTSKIVFMVVKQDNIKTVINTIKKTNPKAFYTIEAVRHVEDPFNKSTSRRKILRQNHTFFKKGK